MHMKGLSAVSLLVALGILAGCDAGNDPGATGDTSFEETGEVPVPDSSATGMENERESQDIAGAGETTGESGQTGETGMGSDMGTEEPGTIGMTEFAALDTNSDGKLGEMEWQPEALGGIEFQQIDEDASGDIDREEFRQALATTDGGQGTLEDAKSKLDTLDPTNEQ